MSDSRQVVTLNVGSQRVTMGVFTKTAKNGLVLNRYAHRVIELDPAQESARLGMVGSAIGELVDELKVKGSSVNYAVSGQSVFMRFVKLPPIENADVAQLLKFEAQQHVPFPIDEVVWDYHLLPSTGGEQEAILVAIKADVLNSLNDEIMTPGLVTGSVDCALIALFNAYRDSYPQETEPVMLIDIGAKSTDLIYTEGGRFFTRSVSAGGIFVTSAIARDFGTSFEEAERAKISNGIVSMTNGQTEGMDPNKAALATSIRNAMTRLASEIQRTTNHYRAQIGGSAPVKAYLCGGGASLPYTKEFLEERLGIPVVFFNPMHQVGVGSGVNVDAISREAFMLGTVVGTALHSVGRSSISIDLVPSSVARVRQAAKKYPKVLAGVGIGILGAAAFAASAFMGVDKAEKAYVGIQEKAESADSIAESISILKKKVDRLDSELEGYSRLVLERYGYSDILNGLIAKAQSNAYWVVDFEPLVNFDLADRSGITGFSLVKDTFLGDRGSSLGEPPVDTSAVAARGNRGRQVKKPAGMMVNAIRLRGFVRTDSGGYNAVQDMQKRLAEKVKESALFTFEDESGNPLEPRQYLVLGETKSVATTDPKNAQAFGQPFTLILPLKTPLPVEKEPADAQTAK